MSAIADRITIDPEQCGGRPCIRGMRIRVSDVLDLLANGLSPDEVIEELPDLEPGDIEASLRSQLKDEMNESWRSRITTDPRIRGGQPCVRGMRITVKDILEYLAGGMTLDELLADFPELTVEDVPVCLEFAASQPRPA